MAFVENFVQKLLHRLPAESAHRLAIGLLQFGHPLLAQRPIDTDPILENRVFGRTFTNPVGLAAGFDKSAQALLGLAACGFGFVEIGTVTPQPQVGNAKPRLFRLTADSAIINRLGFNNDGQRVVAQRLQKARRHARLGPRPIGVNIGVNRDSSDRLQDYALGIAGLAAYADYFVVNISSPNTKGLRQLQDSETLPALLSIVTEARSASAAPDTPILIKLAPDLSDNALADIAQVLLSGGIDGVIIGNTSIGLREHLRDPQASESGGLSGRPLRALADDRLRCLAQAIGGRLPLIGVGGIEDARSAYQKILYGASLVQLYTGFIYHGPALPRQIVRDLPALLRADGFKHISAAIGAGL